MGRLLKRVPLDFDWPIGEIWEGYINPYWDKRRDCSHCEEKGYSPNALRYYKQWYGYTDFDPSMTGSKHYHSTDPNILDIIKMKVKHDIRFYTDNGRRALNEAVLREAIRMCDIWNSCWQYHLSQEDVNALVEAGRLKDFTHDFIEGQGWIEKDPKVVPNAKEVNWWALTGFGHDGMNEYYCIKAKCQREGVELYCEWCNGDVSLWDDPQDEENYENWEEEEPPEGEGYQLWENTSEGSPNSPVFKTLNELCLWCEENATTFADYKATAEEWRKMLDDGRVYHQEGNFVFI